MSLRLTSATHMPAQLAGSAAILAVGFAYLGLSPYVATTSAVYWVLISSAGGWLITSLIGNLRPTHQLLVVLGPGALLGIGLGVVSYLLVRGGPLGFVLVTILALLAVWRWSRVHQSDTSMHAGDAKAPVALLLLISLALIANSKEFPNLLVPGLSVLLAGTAWSSKTGNLWRYGSSLIAVFAAVYDIATRPSYWWWSSDDTTTLAGIGTMIIERGRVADIAGWSTSSHHWLLHAWLALWNSFSSGQIFETYLIAWPLVASVSLCASLWLCIETFLEKRVPATVFVFAGVAAAGLVRLEWPAPQEQQPFLFAMVACCGLWLESRRRHPRVFDWRSGIGVLFLMVVVPSMLFVLKPSLLVAYCLLLLGTGLAHFGYDDGKRMVVALVFSVLAIASGLVAMWFGGSWISARSFTSFAVDWFPADLGWCSSTSVPGSVACVLSLQVVLIVGAALAALVMWGARSSPPLRVPAVVLLPLVVAYLPLRYFVSSGVGSGAPSFYRLPEMAMMLMIVIGLASIVSWFEQRMFMTSLFVITAFAVTLVSRGPSQTYDVVDSIIVAVRPLRFLNAADVTALILVAFSAIAITKSRRFGLSSSNPLTVAACALCLVGLLPLTRLVVDTTQLRIDETRMSRPADFGPPDIDDVTAWLRDNTVFGTVVATNYLCPNDRLVECTLSVPQRECPRGQPVLMAGWALTALSGREFLYLSQGWHYKTDYYFSHQTSVRLGAEISPEAIRELQDLGVSHFVASKAHTNHQAWLQLQSAADFNSPNFAVIALGKLLARVTG